MPFCLENYIPLFKGLSDYFKFISNRLKLTYAFFPPKESIINENKQIKTKCTTEEHSEQVNGETPNNYFHNPTSHYRIRQSLKGNTNENWRSTRNHFLIKAENLEKANNSSNMSIVKKLTVEQRQILKDLELDIQKEEQNELQMTDSSVIEQIKISLTIIRNLVGSTFNEKIVFNEKNLMEILYKLLLYNNDFEIDKLVLENFSVLSR